MQPDNTTRVCSNISKKFIQLSMAQSECTIYRVHRHLRNVNDKAYEPEVIAIGPYHRGKDNLKMMEEHKLRYLHSLLQRKNVDLRKYVSDIKPHAEAARECYAEPISLNPSEFIEMLVLDGCFIIELVRKFKMVYLREKNDPIFHMDWIMNSLQRDLMLFENQIPFFVVCKLFDLIEVTNQHERLIYLLVFFFNDLYPEQVYRESKNRSSSHEIKHLLHLIHNNWLPSHDQVGFSIDKEDERKRWRFINTATCLSEANVKFEKKGVTLRFEEEEEVKSADRRSEEEEEVTLFDIRFEKGTIYLAPLMIEDRTESFLRNLIAYEQYFQDSQYNFVTDYVKFLDCLIDSSRDVEILSRYEIIDNWLGDGEVVANMFNKLTDSVVGPGKLFIYAKIFDNVNIHCNKHRNKWMAKLRREYLNSPWAIISIIAAVVLLILTFVQTVCSILQVV